MSIQTINVYLNTNNKKIKVGTLAYKSQKIYFGYDKDFLKTNIELSPYKLPKKDGVHICQENTFEGLFGVFADSLPDGWGKLLLDRYLLSKGINFRDITQLDRLGHIGEFGMGALTYEPILENITFDEDEISLEKIAQSSQKILQGTSTELLDTLLAIDGSSAGARPKAMIQIDNENNIIHGSQTLQKGYQHYIVKFPNSLDDKDIGKIEYIYSMMAKDAKINIPNTKLLHIKTNSYFAIKRFDRVQDKRVHIHSVAGLTHTDFRMPTVDYDDLLGLTLHLTKDVSQQSMMFRLAVFNLLTHNRDDHAKNFSFLLDNQNNWKLSPAYDLTFSFGPNGEHSTTYLGEGKKPTLEHIHKLAKKHNIKNSEQIISEVQDGVKNFKKYAKELRISQTSYKNIYGSFLI